VEIYLDSREWVLLDKYLRQIRKTLLNNRTQTTNPDREAAILYEVTAIDGLWNKLHPKKEGS
jgi:hypothetical protein